MVEKGKNMKIDGFIEIERGLWYRESDGKPFSTRRQGSKHTNWHLRALNTKNQGGYYRVTINNRLHTWHRAVYCFFMKKGIPNNYEIDHINNDSSDNRISNLQCVPMIQNQNKRLVSKINTSYLPWVSWHKLTEKWMGGIQINRKKYHMGLFEDPYRAYEVCLAKKIAYYGEESVVHYPTLDEAKKIALTLCPPNRHQ